MFISNNRTLKRIAGLIQNTTNQVHLIAQKNIARAVSQEGKEVERVAPVVIKKSIEELYKSPFRLLGIFDQQKYHAALRKLNTILHIRIGLQSFTGYLRLTLFFV